MEQTSRPGSQQASGVEDVARRRLPSLRLARGWTLDELARRSHIGASTISRIETGHRRLAIDNLADLARALETTVDELIANVEDEDVIIRPIRDEVCGSIHWNLTRHHDPSRAAVTKMRIPASKETPEQRVHPGRDWMYVLEGTARLLLGDREHLVQAGQAADFDTMTPHAVSGYGGPVEVLMIFDHHGEQAHLRASTSAPRPGSR